MPLDYSGHTPKAENWQIQEADGTSLAGHDYATRDEAVLQANKLSIDYQVPLVVKRTV